MQNHRSDISSHLLIYFSNIEENPGPIEYGTTQPNMYRNKLLRQDYLNVRNVCKVFYIIMSICWIPSHRGMIENEEADRLANIGVDQPQEETVITFDIVKAKIRNLTHPRAQETYTKKEEIQNRHREEVASNSTTTTNNKQQQQQQQQQV